MAFSGLAHLSSSKDTAAIANDDDRQRATKTEDVPGGNKKLTTRLLDTGFDVLENFAPVKGIHQHVCAFHFYANDINRQVEAHHYCSHVNEDVRQCVLYDSDQKGAKLIGVEYIVADHVFDKLPDDEKKYWHSHVYEVKSGQLYAPNIPATVELADMAKVVKTYGKTWHFWQVDRGDPLPMGPPQLMMAFTKDGQLDPELEKARLERERVNTQKLREMRQHLEEPKVIDPLADHWEHSMDGKVWQVKMEKVLFKPLQRKEGQAGAKDMPNVSSVKL